LLIIAAGVKKTMKQKADGKIDTARPSATRETSGFKMSKMKIDADSVLKEGRRPGGASRAGRDAEQGGSATDTATKVYNICT